MESKEWLFAVSMSRHMEDIWPLCFWARTSLTLNVEQLSLQSQILSSTVWSSHICIYCIYRFSCNIVNNVLLFSKDNWSLSSHATTASAFSERYLGSKTDSRVYSVKLLPTVSPPPPVCDLKCRSDGWSWRLMQFARFSFSHRWRIWRRERVCSRRSSTWSSTQPLMVTETFHFSALRWSHHRVCTKAMVTQLSNLSSLLQKRFTSSTRPNLSAIWSARMLITLYRWAPDAPNY